MTKEASRRYRERHPERVLDSALRYDERHPGRRQARLEAYRASHRDILALQMHLNYEEHREDRLERQKAKYHIVRQQVLAALMTLQEGRCGLCRELLVSGVHVDHDNSCCPPGTSCPRCVRGALCPRCNQNVGGVEMALKRGAITHIEGPLVEYCSKRPLLAWDGPYNGTFRRPRSERTRRD